MIDLPISIPSFEVTPIRKTPAELVPGIDGSEGTAKTDNLAGGVAVPIPTLPLNILLPANVCAPVVTIPPLVALAGVKLKTPAVIVPPLVVDEPPIAPIVVAAEAVYHVLPL